MKTDSSENKLMEDIGVRFKTLREEMGKSQQEIAIDLDIPQSTISQIESGAIFPSLATVNSLADRYQIGLNWLINGKGTMKTLDLDERYTNLLEKMKNPKVEAFIFAKLMETEIYLSGAKH